jgi:hypothetical protein
MRCHELDELLIAYQDGEAPLAQRELIELHLRSCAACRNRLAADRLVVQRIRALAERPRSVPLARRQALLRRTAAPARSWRSFPGRPWSARYLHAPRLDDDVPMPGGFLTDLASIIAALLLVTLIVGTVVLFAGQSLSSQVGHLSLSPQPHANHPATGWIAPSYAAVLPAACGLGDSAMQSAGPTTYLYNRSPNPVITAGKTVTLTVVPGHTFGASTMTIIAFPVGGPPCAQLRFTAKPDRQGHFTVPITLPLAGRWWIEVQFGGHYCRHPVQVNSPAGTQATASLPIGVQNGSPIFGARPVFWLMSASTWRSAPVTVTLQVLDGYQESSLPILAVPLDTDNGSALRYPAMIAWNRLTGESDYAVPIRLPTRGAWLLIAQAGTMSSAIVIQNA